MNGCYRWKGLDSFHLWHLIISKDRVELAEKVGWYRRLHR
jgi:hypothetical protein